MTTCKMFIGLPASGKSTLVKKIKKPGDWLYSTDAFIERIAKAQGSTYDDVFQKTIKQASSEMDKYLTVAIATKTPIIWDQTNLSAKKRKRVITKMHSYGYSVSAYYVSAPVEVDDIVEWNKRLHARKGKNIPEHIVSNMVRSFEPPTLEEGFTSIRSYNIYGDCYEFET